MNVKAVITLCFLPRKRTLPFFSQMSRSTEQLHHDYSPLVDLGLDKLTSFFMEKENSTGEPRNAKISTMYVKRIGTPKVPC